MAYEENSVEEFEKQGPQKKYQKFLNTILCASNSPDAPKKPYWRKALDLLKPAKEKENVLTRRGTEEDLEFLTWKRRTFLFLDTLSMSVSLGQIWRFPSLAKAHGGGAFFIIYAFTISSLGNTMFFLETATGQYSSRNPSNAYMKIPLFEGLGWAMILYSFLFCTYYNHLVSFSLYYMFSAFAKTTPWSYCPDYDPDSTNYRCMPYSKLRGSELDGVICGGRGFLYNRSLLCSNSEYAWQQQNVCCDLAQMADVICESMFNVTDLCLPRKFPAEFHWSYTVNNEHREDDPDYGYVGPIVPSLMGYSFLAWFLVYLILYKGLKLLRYLMYGVVPICYVMLFIIFAIAIDNDGAVDGIRELFVPTGESFADINTWRAAVEQAFYSIAVGMGFLITLGSTSKFQNPSHIEGIFVCLSVFITSLLCSAAVFSVVGFLSHKTEKPFTMVIESGPGLLFIAYAVSLNLLPASSFFSIVFFFVLTILGLSAVSSIIQTVSAAVCGLHPSLKKIKFFVDLVIVFSCFSLGIPIATRGGLNVFYAFDFYAAGLTLIPICAIELFVLLVFYKIGRFCEDISFMLGFYPSRYYRYLWLAGFFILMPLFIYSLVDLRVKNLKEWVHIMGWVLFACILVIIPLGMGVKSMEFYRKKKIKKIVKTPLVYGPKNLENWEDRRRYSVKRQVF